MKTTINLFTGQNILQSTTDKLKPISLKGLFDLIQNPDQRLIVLGSQLMKIKSIDERAYHKLKTKLPYFIGADFKNNIRKTENFIGIQWVIIDIDKCFITLDKEIELKDILKKDQRIALMYTSPSNEGLKLLFKLTQPITDSSLYVNFYKAFSAEIARHYQLEKYIDFKTSDVTRISFLSADGDAYLNENATSIDWRSYLSKYDLLNTKEKLSTVEKNKDGGKNINEDVYTEILQRLNPKTPKRKKIIFVPEVLNSIVQPITNFSKKMGFIVDEIKDIHYGKKFVFRHEHNFAEINVYYGKSGFSVAISAKRGHNEPMSLAAKAVIEKVLFDDPLRNSINSELEQVLKNSINNLNFN
jgi:hypothetical protein